MIVVDFLEIILFMLLIRESFLDKKKKRGYMYSYS